MAITKSGFEECCALDDLVKTITNEIADLVREGKKVHIIWDYDFVLATGRSEDIFTMNKYDLGKYFDYEERLCRERPESEVWLRLAKKCGKLHTSQDIVTARSSFLAKRVYLFVLELNLPIRWQLFIGHQPKKESYKIILESLKGPEWHVFLIDDAKKHVDTFLDIAKELGWQERARGIQAPQIRHYDEEELAAYYNGVAQATGKPRDIAIRYNKRILGKVKITPGGPRQLEEDERVLDTRCHMEEVVATHRDSLLEQYEELVERGLVKGPPTTNLLYSIFDITIENAIRS